MSEPQKQDWNTCRWRYKCIDPCHNCPTFDITDDRGYLIPGKKYCDLDCQSAGCYLMACPTCKAYERGIPW